LSRNGYGTLYVIAGPSGAGKTTLAHHLVDTGSRISFSVSATTRKPRPGEVHGTDYLFMTRDEFRELEDRGWFLETAVVHGNLYGTPAGRVRDMLSMGESIVLDIDVQGAMRVRQSFPGAVLVFILPPSPEVLRRRLVDRGTDSSGEIEARMREAASETRWAGIFDYFVLNDSIEEAKVQLDSIVGSIAVSLDRIPFPEGIRELDPETYAGRDYWNGKKVVVTAGPTREMIDDVRFVSNRSSGLMGYSMAMAFRDAGARVTLVSGPCGPLPPPPAVTLVRVESASDLAAALTGSMDGADLLAMAAAVSDYSPGSRSDGKLDRSGGGLDLRLEPTEDILANVAGTGSGSRLLAFALEYGPDAEERALDKMSRKGADAVFVNRGGTESSGMESPFNSGVLLFPDGTRTEVPGGSKRFVAEAAVAALGRRFGRDGGAGG
jgi:guanylate kinase